MYTPPNPTHWTGRQTPPGTPPDYWYQVVRMLDLTGPATEWPAADYALLGYACEEGVRRNQGRPGAAAGPAAIVDKLGRLANHLDDVRVVDAGTVSCPDGDLEATQLAFGRGIHQLLERGITPIGLGGGHDIAYAHFLGIWQYLRDREPTARLGIINVDAHLDLRPFSGGSTSGTPFRQILEFHGDRVDYLPIGIQEAANPPSLLRTAERLGVTYLTAEECNPDGTENLITEALAAFIYGVDHIYLTIDLDGMASAYAPGVSAPSPLGLTPTFVVSLIQMIRATDKLLSVDMAELSPLHDREGVTATLAARIVAALTLPDN